MSQHHDDVAGLLGAYALNAVEPDERVLVEAHLEGCPRCRGELADHERVAALLGNSGGDAPPGVWDRIASTLETAAPPMRLELSGPSGGGRVVPLAAARRRPSRTWLVAAAAAAVVIGLLGAEVVRQDDRIDSLQAAIGDGAMAQASSVAFADPDAALAELTSADGDLRAPAALLPDGTGYLVARDLPPLDRDRTYQLWGQTAAGLVSLGLLGHDPGDVVAFHAGAPVTALAVTDEASPGVAQSANPPVVTGALA